MRKIVSTLFLLVFIVGCTNTTNKEVGLQDGEDMSVQKEAATSEEKGTIDKENSSSPNAETKNTEQVQENPFPSEKNQKVEIDENGDYSFEYLGPLGDDQIYYSKLNKKTIRQVGNEYGIENPYIPMRNLGSEYVMEIRTKENGFKIVYPHYSITQSVKDFLGFKNRENLEGVELNNGENAYWTPRGELYFKKGNVFIAISSAKISKKFYLEAANSIIQIDEID